MRRFMLAAVVLIVMSASAVAQTPPAGTLRRPVGSQSGPVIVPDHFLRPWDPVTVFFTRPVGKAPGTPEDNPGRFVSMTPGHPGAWTWIDARTLQFRPADAWPPLERLTWTIGRSRFVLHTLMPAPVSTVPGAGATDLDPVREITLTFPQPIDPRALAKMITLELRPLPGAGSGESRWLTRENYTIKAMERAKPDAPAAYVFHLDTPVPYGTSVTVHVRLSLDDSSRRSFARITFSTAPPFRVTAVGAGRDRLPIASGGSHYTKDEALQGGSERVLEVELSSTPSVAGPLAVRTLLRISPAVTNLKSSVHGRWIAVAGDFARGTLYRVRIVPAPLEDSKGRRLQVVSPSELYVIFPRQTAFLELPSGRGVLERYGPQVVPVKGRGQTRADLRIYPVDPLDRSFWPFAAAPVSVDESRRPPGPGEDVGPPTGLAGPDPYGLMQHLVTLGSPPVSEMIELPLKAGGGAATFGLDLAPFLKKLAPAGAPGTYLVGLRSLDAGTIRQWMRVQVTDLSLTAAEGPAGAKLAVTSLSTAQPVGGATVRVEGLNDSRTWTTFLSGTTGPDGMVFFEPLGGPCWRYSSCRVLRIVVTKGSDVLVIDPTHPPDLFHDGSWSKSDGTWLQWLLTGHASAVPEIEWLSHIFTERPVYRPGQTVLHIKGYVRTRSRGTLTIPSLAKAFVVVRGPGDLEWRRAVTLTAEGSFYTAFTKKDAPTGEYSAHLEAVYSATGESVTSRNVSFRVEAYRIPRFEVDLHGPDRTSLDEPFRVSLTATYYAGGRVAGRPVSWRVTQFPYTWHAPGREGFVFSSDVRFSGHGRFEATPELTRKDRTGPDGGASLQLNPAIEPTAQPRTYVVEATVTGADDQTVTSTRKVVALPSFVLGLKVPRYLVRGKKLVPQILVLDADGAPRAGVAVTVRLKSRQWRSYLRASDFTNGTARYVTDIVDTTVQTKKITSGEKPLTVDFGVRDSGVWVVELEARDAVGRSQTVAVDLYAGGEQAVTWPRPSTKTIKVVSDRQAYDPGQVAKLLIESPFQRGRILAVVEAPEANRYSWLDVDGGKAVFKLPVKPTWAPSIPVHFILMRGRLPGTRLLPGSTTDLGKPATMAATSWVKVNPRANTVKVALEYPAHSLPGKTITVKISLSKPDGARLPGEVTLWLVDQAVLALGKEQPLDPLRDFILQRPSRLGFRDTRDLPFGEIPFTAAPGGGEAALKSKRHILERATVRRNFKPVPYYNPRIMVGPDGTATVTVELPDNLTNFKIRAKAVSGPDRFGFATGAIAVRLPLIVQPALPRFVRPGDAFTAAAIGRVVEGKGGPGAAEIQVAGVTLEGKARRELVWAPNQPLRIPFEVRVPTPAYGARSGLGDVTFRVGVTRQSDGATDAFEVKLPVRADRSAVVHRVLKNLEPGVEVALPPVEGGARPGTVQRTVVLSTQPGLVRMAAGLSFLMEYPFGCTEQRISRATAFLEARRFNRLLALRADTDELKRVVDGVLAWIPGVIQPDGLVAYWPGSRGYVILTAWTVQFMAEA
ncbi:MAG: alpha-2-macroglobulin, partial [Acidobacteria bacterium]|nr:alpha-2-macroglobulin [Acidobacteriota bacterium]